MSHKIFTQNDIFEKIVLVRADLNVPMKDGVVLDQERMMRLKPTIDLLKQYGAKTIVIMSHFGRPKSSVNQAMWDKTQSLQQIVDEFSKVLAGTVEFVPDCLAFKAQGVVSGKIYLLENLRYYPGEEANDQVFANALSQGIDVYINDAFSCSHRAHASIVAITKCLPSFMGVSLLEEVKALEKVLTSPERPVVAVVGGSKVSTKLELLNNLIHKVEHLIIGGAMANTFLKAKGVKVGASLVEDTLLETARHIMDKAASAGCTIHLPVDALVGESIHDQKPACVDLNQGIDSGMLLDFGPKTTAHIVEVLENSKTCVWNGPVGAYEFSPYETASVYLAEVMALLCKRKKLICIAGGGDTVAVVKMAEAYDDLTYVSTAGGAFLEWLEGKVLPGIAALQNE